MRVRSLVKGGPALASTAVAFRRSRVSKLVDQKIEKLYILRCVAGRRLPWAGRAGRRLNDKESLMVHWGRPTTPAMAGQHKLQLALLLDMDKKDSAEHQEKMIVGLLPG